ncbi:MAG: ABC transporter substrate-binding protein [Ruminiclostridium sp.]|nr:ABC transporter substrate-binding protein [Ruminiclostridium sp.]
MKNIMKKTSALILGAVMPAAILSGCGSGSGAQTAQTQAENAEMAAPAAQTESAAEKTLTFGCQMYSDGLINPASQTNCAWNCMRFGVSEALFKFNDNMEIEPWLAESYEVSADRLTWTIKLRDGITFSNGTPLTATKVKESLDWVREKGPDGSSNPQKYLEFDAEVTADDAANTITIKTVTPYVNLTGNLAYPVMAIIDVAETSDFDSGVIGTGPYKVKEFHDQVGFDMIRNDNYWNGDVPYDNVKILFMGDASAKANALRAGQVDLVENITNVADIKSLQEDSSYTVDIASGVRCGFTWMNQSGVLANDTLRQAILMAIDYDTICSSNTIGGLYTAGFSVLPSTLAYGYDKLTNPYAYDPDGAKKLLDDAGIVDTDGNGIRELDGKDIDLTYVSYENRMLNDFSDAHTMYLADLGIGVTARYGSSDDQWNALVAGDYDLNNNNWTTVGTGDPTEYMANWYSKSGADYCAYQNDEYDKLYEQLLNEADTAKRADIIRQLQQILVNDAVAIVDGYYNSSMAYSKNVGYAHIHTADYYWITTEIRPAD